MTTYAELNELDGSKATTAADFLQWFKKVDKLIALATSFGDKMAEKVMSEQLESIGEMYKMVTGEVAPDKVKGECSNRLCGEMRGGGLT
jgi:hypothetical protein